MPNLQDALLSSARNGIGPEQGIGGPPPEWPEMDMLEYLCMRAGAVFALEEFQRRWDLATGLASLPLPFPAVAASTLARSLLDELPGYVPPDERASDGPANFSILETLGVDIKPVEAVPYADEPVAAAPAPEKRTWFQGHFEKMMQEPEFAAEYARARAEIDAADSVARTAPEQLFFKMARLFAHEQHLRRSASTLVALVEATCALLTPKVLTALAPQDRASCEAGLASIRDLLGEAREMFRG